MTRVRLLLFVVRTASGEHHWPSFNVADSAICIGIGVLLAASWRQPSAARCKGLA